MNRVRCSLNVGLGPGLMIKFSDYVRVLYHTNIVLDTHIKLRDCVISNGPLV